MNPGDWWYIREGSEKWGWTYHFENSSQLATINTTSLTIGPRSRRRVEEPGGGIDISGTTPPMISWNAPSDVESTFIEGLQLEYLSANSLRIKAGAAYIPLTGVADMSADLDFTGLTLTANTWYYLYCHDAGGGVLGIDPPSTVAPNTTPYRGNARSKGPDVEPDLTRRYIPNSAIRCSSVANTLLRFEKQGNFTKYQTDLVTTRVLNAGAASANTLIACAAFIPPTTTLGEFQFHGDYTNTNRNYYFHTPGDGLSPAAAQGQYTVSVTGGTTLPRLSGPLFTDSSQQIEYGGGGAGANVSIYVSGYWEER